MSKFKGLSGNMLKLMGAAAMLLDHMGLMFFPGNEMFRILGRLAFPIFAFMIAEGAKYTRNRRRYLGQLLALATSCQAVYFLVDGSLYLSVLFTFSLSLGMIFALQNWKRQPSTVSFVLFLASVGATWALNRIFTIDYGFFGCTVPVFAALPHGTKFDRKEISTACLGLGLLLLAWDIGAWQIWSLAALPLLLLYSGQRGKYRMKYFFYIFYPAHLALLQVLAWMV